MNIFAKDYTARVLKGSAATAFFWVDTLLTLVPLVIVTWVLLKLVAATRQRIALSNAFIVLSFVIIWGAAIWRLNREFNTLAYELAITPLPVATEPAAGAEPAAAEVTEGQPAEPIVASLLTDVKLAEGQEVIVVDLAGKGGSGTLRLLSETDAPNYSSRQQAVVRRILGNENEVTASWFQVLNSFFIIALAPLIGKIWETRLNPSAPVKFGLGLILLGVGFAALGLACQGLEKGENSPAQHVVAGCGLSVPYRGRTVRFSGRSVLCQQARTGTAGGAHVWHLVSGFSHRQLPRWTQRCDD